MRSERGLSVAENKDTGFRVITSVIKPAFKMHFSPTIIGSENIPKDGAVVIAGNHKNIRDQFLVFLATDRVINYMLRFLNGRGASPSTATASTLRRSEAR